MARIADPRAMPSLDEDDRADEETSGRITARTLAAALALLAIAVLVATRSQAAFNAEAATTDVAVAVGDVALTDDDRGASLFSIPALAPDRPVERCILVEFEGNLLPSDIQLAAEAEGSLARGLTTEVEMGDGGRYGDCSGFLPETTVFEGSLRELADGDALDTFTAYENPSSRTFRFTFTLDDAGDVEGAEAEAAFEWTAESG